jgi:hypothetical protein
MGFVVGAQISRQAERTPPQGYEHEPTIWYRKAEKFAKTKVHQSTDAATDSM